MLRGKGADLLRGSQCGLDAIAVVRAHAKDELRAVPEREVASITEVARIESFPSVSGESIQAGDKHAASKNTHRSPTVEYTWAVEGAKTSQEAADA